MGTPHNPIHRRQFLTVTSGATLAALIGSNAHPQTVHQAQNSLIANENLRTGANDWQLTRVRLDAPAGIRSSTIEGYCSRQSVPAGQTIDIFVSTKPPARFIIEIFRTGYYGGSGARLMTTLGPFKGMPQPIPKMGEKRIVECRWEASTSIRIPDDWPSGVYLGRLTTLPGSLDLPYWQSYVVFIVSDSRIADILVQCSDNTWQAYNKWPDNTSLYTDPRGAHARGVAVSFDRPYGKVSQIYENPQSVGSHGCPVMTS